jgi:hypothetical protein
MYAIVAWGRFVVDFKMNRTNPKFGWLAAALIAMAGCNAGSVDKKNNAEKARMMSISYGLDEGEYWTNPNRTLEATVQEAVRQDFRGLLLEGPRTVDTERRSTLPLVGLRSATFEENFYLRHVSHAVIVGVSSGDNSVLAAPAWQDKSEDKEDYTPPAEGFPEGFSLSPFDLEVRERLPEMPWGPGKWTFTLYLFNQQSNPVLVEFKAGMRTQEGSEEPPASHPQRIRPAPDPEAGHSFAKSAESPELPGGEGIALKMDRKEIAPGSRACMLRGAFRLKALPGERLDARPGEPAPAGAEGAEAIVPITLLLLGKEIAGPYLFTLHAPARASSVQGMVEGHFHVNLFRMPEAFGIPQAYVARALHGRAQSEAVGFEIEKSADRH